MWGGLILHQFLWRRLGGGGGVFLKWFGKDSDTQSITSSRIRTSSHCVKTCMSSGSMMRHCKREETALHHCSTATLNLRSEECASARERATPDLPRTDLRPSTPALNLTIFPTFYSSVIRTSDDLLMWTPLCKLLKTWQLLASCEGGASPSWQ